MKKQILFDTIKRNAYGHAKYGKSGSHMYREGGFTSYHKIKEWLLKESEKKR